jgi:hypothetical protein
LTSAGASRGQSGERPSAERSNFISQKNEKMTYLQQFEAELTAKLENGTDNTTAIVRWVSEKVLESYRNGITAGQKGAQVIRQGKSRRPFPKQAQ